MIRLVLRRLFSFGGRERVLPCREVMTRLSEFVERELGPEMMGKIHEHLAVCAACRRFVESLKRTSRMPRLDPFLPMPDEAARKLIGGPAREVPPSPTGDRRTRSRASLPPTGSGEGRLNPFSRAWVQVAERSKENASAQASDSETGAG